MNALSIPFSHHIANCVRNGNYRIVRGRGCPDYVINADREGEKDALTRIYGEPCCTRSDDWSMGIKSWCFGLFPRVWVYRGEQRFYLKLNRHESAALAHIVKAIFDERKDAIKAAKLQRKISNQQAYFLNAPL